MLPALALALFASTATAAPLGVWTGPGDRDRPARAVVRHTLLPQH